MDRRRTDSPVYARQWSGSSSTGSSSPVGSPAHPRSRLPPAASGAVKQQKNVAAKAAAQRLAQVMAQTATMDDDEEDDPGFAGSGSASNLSRSNNNGLAAVSLGRPNRSPSPALGRNHLEHTPAVRSTSAGRPSMTVRGANTASVVPSVRNTLRTSTVIQPVETASFRAQEKRFTQDIGRSSLTGSSDEKTISNLQDELDLMIEDNDKVNDKLLCALKENEELNERIQQLERQVASPGWVSIEAKYTARKEEMQRQKEAANKQSNNERIEEIKSLQADIKDLEEEIKNAVEQQREAESEAKSLRVLTQRMILTHEEMEEVVLKRCWLARYWSLAVQYGICADVAASKHEHWSSLAPLPFEVVISAGQKAREESWTGGDDSDRRTKHVRDLSDLTGEGNIESMLSVEMGLRELASLKVEDAVVIALAQDRRSSLLRQSFLDPKSAAETKYLEAFELSHEEAEEIHFKEAWLTYFWRRAKVHGVEEDIAEERLQFWISRSSQSPTSHYAVDVERGLMELRKLGIEQQLWEASRREIEQEESVPNGMSDADSDNSS